MKTNLLAVALLFGTSGYAIAADAVVDDVVIIDSVHDWSGVYAGALLGYGWAANQTSMVYESGGGPASSPWFDYDGDGFTGGAIAGANWQTGAWVYGLEGDISAANVEGQTSFTQISGSGDEAAFAIGSLTPMNFTTELQWYGTLRGRVGYSFDRMLLYGTAGLAVGGVKSTFFDTVADSGDTTTQVGYAVGAGAEAALNNDWSLRLEYLYIDLGDDRHEVTVSPLQGLDFFIDTDMSFQTVRTALVYNF